MGEVKHTLARGDYSAAALPYAGRFVIEDNVGETVHVHMGHLRLEFTPEQFLWLADQCAAAAKAMRRIRGL